MATGRTWALGLVASLAASASCGACGGTNAQTDIAAAPEPSAGPTESGAPDGPRPSEPGVPKPTPAPSQPGGPAPLPGTTVPAIPAGLACLAKHYVGQAAAMPSGGFALVLPDGTRLPWDDGQTKTYEQKLEGPDLEDTLAMPYKVGPIVPVNTLNDDPGRVRSDLLFKATFGASEAAVASRIVDVPFLGQTFPFHQRAAPALKSVEKRLKAAIAADPTLSPFVTGSLGGTFVWRPIANTTRMSAHSYAIAIDIVVSKSNYWENEKQGGSFTWKNKIPQAIVDAFEAEGFAWGGRWYHYDTMHFEYRPELFDPSCK